jgi:hypothetical protein
MAETEAGTMRTRSRVQGPCGEDRCHDSNNAFAFLIHRASQYIRCLFVLQCYNLLRVCDMEESPSGFPFSMALFCTSIYVQTSCAIEKETLMSDDLATLESQRSNLMEEFLRLGDLRPGSITAVTRRCGKPSCHCAKHNDPGHDPQFRLTRRVSGKTVTETFPNPTALRKAQQEVAEFHRFQKLSQDLVAVNDRICRLRPVAQERGGWTEQEKKRLLRSIRK